MSRVTDLDLGVSKKIRAMREKAGLTQPQVAGHLGIVYQSYQKMEAGKHSFRASTLDRLGVLYNVPLWSFIGAGEEAPIPSITKICMIFHTLTEEERDEVVKEALLVKSRRVKT